MLQDLHLKESQRTESRQDTLRLPPQPVLTLEEPLKASASSSVWPLPRKRLTVWRKTTQQFLWLLYAKHWGQWLCSMRHKDVPSSAWLSDCRLRDEVKAERSSFYWTKLVFFTHKVSFQLRTMRPVIETYFWKKNGWTLSVRQDC